MDTRDTEVLLPPSNKATRVRLFSFAKPHMRTFHMAWFAFFLAFFGWFGIAPMMALVRDDLGLTKTQIGNTIIASVAITILARLLIGWLCDRIGPPPGLLGSAGPGLHPGDVQSVWPRVMRPSCCSGWPSA